LHAAASLEQFSKHPLAGAVTQAARDENLVLMEVAEIRESPGEGMESAALNPQILEQRMEVAFPHRVRIPGRAVARRK